MTGNYVHLSVRGRTTSVNDLQPNLNPTVSHHRRNRHPVGTWHYHANDLASHRQRNGSLVAIVRRGTLSNAAGTYGHVTGVAVHRNRASVHGGVLHGVGSVAIVANSARCAANIGDERRPNVGRQSQARWLSMVESANGGDMKQNQNGDGESGWIAVVGLIVLILVLVTSCEMYTDCLADGLPRYECAHYTRMGR